MNKTVANDGILEREPTETQETISSLMDRQQVSHRNLIEAREKFAISLRKKKKEEIHKQ